MKLFLNVLFTIFLTHRSLSMELPSYMQQCSRSDPNLNECALKAGRESIHQFSLGDPSRGLPPLDPLYVGELVVMLPNENGVKLIFKDNYFHGFSNMNLESLKFDLDKKIITADAMVNLEVKNHYDLSGRILIMPVKSNGDSSIKLKNANLHIRYWYEHVVGEDGKIHWKINKHDIKYEVERAYFRLENLLGDKNIGDQVNKFLNEMWREIVVEVGPVISKSLSEAVVQNIGIFLEQVSYDELMPE